MCSATSSCPSQREARLEECSTPHRTPALAQPHAPTKGHQSTRRANRQRRCTYIQRLSGLVVWRFLSRYFHQAVSFGNARLCGRQERSGSSDGSPTEPSYCTWSIITVQETGSARVLPRVATCAVCIRRSNSTKNDFRATLIRWLAGPLYMWLLCTKVCARSCAGSPFIEQLFLSFWGSESSSCAILHE